MARSGARNLANSNIKFSYYNSSTELHTKGMVFGIFFWRLRQQLGANQLTRLMELALQSMKAITAGSDNEFDFDDFYTALTQSTRPGETALVNAINSVFNTMNDLPAPPSGNPPPPPINVDGQAFGCTSGWSTFRIWWSASSGASSYQTFFRGQSGVYYYDYTFPGTGPYYAYVPYSTDWRIKACNANGCSPLSADNVVTPHNLCGF